MADVPDLQSLMASVGLQAPPGSPAPLPPQATPAPLPNPVPPGYNPFDPKHAGPPPPGAASPIAMPAPPAPSPSPNTDNALTPKPPPPLTPGSTPQTSADLSSDFNTFLKSMMHFAPAGPDRLNPFNREHQALVLQHEADREQGVLDESQKRLAASQRARADAEMAQLKPLFDEQGIRVKAAQGEVDKVSAQLPAYHPPPVINTKDAEGFMWGALAVALIGGLAGKAGWMRVTQNFNGLVTGLIQGNEERVRQYNEAYKISYESAMANLRTSQENFKNILFATDVPINQILKQAEVQAKIDGADEKFLLAQQGHIDKLRSQVTAMDRLADNLAISNSKLQEQIDASVMRLGSGRQAMAGGLNLDEYGKWFLASVTAAGDKSMFVAATSRWASPQRAEIINSVAKEFYDQGLNPAEFNESQINLKVQAAAQRWSVLREQALGRLQNSLAGLEQPLKEAVYQANQLHSRALNEPMNALIKRFGAGPATEKIAYVNQLAYTVGLEYQTLATMPASNAQMHWGAQDRVNSMVKGTMSLAELQGFYEAVKLEVINNRRALNDAVSLSMQDVATAGGMVRPEDFGLPNRPQRTPAQMESQYGPNPNAPAPAR